MVVSTIPVIALPKQEQDGARNLNTYLSQLDEYRSRFRSALALFDEAQRIVQIEESRRDEILERMSQTIKSCPVIEIEKLRPVHRERAILLMESKNAIMIPRDWYFMAVRDAAFTIFHFGETFGAIRDTLARCPKLLGLVGDISPEILSSRIPDHKSV